MQDLRVGTGPIAKKGDKVVVRKFLHIYGFVSLVSTLSRSLLWLENLEFAYNVSKTRIC